MSRLPAKTRETLDDDGQALWDFIAESRGSFIVVDGSLIGPFNPWVIAPDVGRRLADLGTALRFRTSIGRRLLEVAIITVGAHWQAEFEWWAHSRMAREHGVAQDVIAAIAAGDEPPFTDAAEAIVYRCARQLTETGRLDAETYAAAQDLLGDRGVVELVSLCGYYTLVCFTLNAFEVPLPPGQEPTWPRP